MGNFTHLKHRQLSPYRNSATKGVHKMQELRPGSPDPQAQLIASPTVSTPLTSVTKGHGLQLQGTNHPALLPAPTDGLLTTAPSPAPAYFLGYFPSFHKRASARHRRDAPVSAPSGAARSGPRGGGAGAEASPRGPSAEGKRLMHISQEISTLVP